MQECGKEINAFGIKWRLCCGARNTDRVFARVYGVFDFVLLFVVVSDVFIYLHTYI